jgi:hypothetical protein
LWKNLVETNIKVGTHSDAIIAQAMQAGEYIDQCDADEQESEGLTGIWRGRPSEKTLFARQTEIQSYGGHGSRTCLLTLAGSRIARSTLLKRFERA